MGRFARLINFIRRQGNRSDARSNPGGGATVDAYHMQPAGDDAHPLPGDDVILVEVRRKNNYAAVGYRDPQNAQSAQPGERRVYARSADGTQVVELFLHNDGQARLANGAGFVDLAPDGTIEGNSGGAIMELQPGGQGEIRNGAGFMRLMPNGFINLNGLMISPSGQLTDANGIELHGHSHTQPNDSDNDVQQRTNTASMAP
ncbi:putative baseplate assembly protein [Vibrio phage CKB-S1]|nr:putative baseplate assembly protein [Vibrio phage CKB-S1]